MLAKADINKIAMVSCNPASFARDASILVNGGFKLEWVQVIDQFLFSNHLEIVGAFYREELALPNNSKTGHNSSMMKKRSMTIHGHRTSVSLEEPFWATLRAIADQRGLSLASLVQIIDKERSSLSSALRLFVLAELIQNTAGHATNIK